MIFFSSYQSDMVLNIDDRGTHLEISIDYWDARISSHVADQLVLAIKTNLIKILEDSPHQ